MNTRWIEVFRAGKQTDSAGNTKDWTTEDLDTIVKTYNDQPADARHEAPVVLGHPETDKPAYGWVQQLKREGNILLAELKDLSDNFVEMVKNGMYKKRSISLYADMLLKHIGFLGAVPPAVKGLADPIFNHAGVSTTIEFEEEKIEFKEEKEDNTATQKFTIELSEEDTQIILNNIIGKLMNKENKLVTWLKSKFSEDEAATKVIEAVANYSEEDQIPAPTPESKTADFKESSEYKEMLVKQQESDAKIAKMQETARRKEWDNFTEGEIGKPMADGRLLPADKEAAVEYADALYTSQKVEFSDNGNLVKDTNGAKKFTAWLEAMTPKISFGTQAGKEGREEAVTPKSQFSGMTVDPARELQYNEAMALIATEAAKGNTITYEEAVDLVVLGGN